MIEGDLIKIKADVIFDVKGFTHPPGKIVAFPRFFLDSSGEREKDKITYKKIYSFSERFEFLEKNYPKYIVFDPVFDEILCEVPIEDVCKHYKPVHRLRELRRSNKLKDLEEDALEFFKIVKDYTKVSWNKMGISGSVLVKLFTSRSDIDPIIYGSKNGQKVYKSLKLLMSNLESDIRPYTKREMRRLYNFRVRDTHMSFKDFIKIESRKSLQGFFRDREFYVRLVKDWSEINPVYGAIQYKNVGYAKIQAVIEDAEANFTPCTYQLRNLKVQEGCNFPIEEITSFRGRFCEQAEIGESIIAQGKVEKILEKDSKQEYFRLTLGNSPRDYMILA